MRILLCTLFFLFVLNEQVAASFVPDHFYVRKIIITGNEHTQEQTILREIKFKAGARGRGSQHTISASVNALVNLNLFNSIDIHLDNVAGDTVDVHIALVEKWYFWPLPFFEFADRNFNQWYDLDLSPDRTNYGLYLFKYNNFGLNQTMKLSLVAGYTDLMQLEYRIPFLPKFQKIGLSGKVSYKRNHEIWLTSTDNRLQFLKHNNEDMIRRFNSKIGMSYRPNKEQTFFLFDIDYQNINVHDSVATSPIQPAYLQRIALPRQIEPVTNNSVLTLGLQYIFERRDNRLFPTAGSFFSIRLEERLLDGEQLNYSADIESAIHITQGWRGNFGIGVQGHYNSRDNLAYAYLPALGYDRLVRGFEDYVVTGPRYALFKSHYKYRLHRKKHEIGLMPLKAYKTLPLDIYASVHVDGAYVDNPNKLQSNSLESAYLLGYGIGIDMLFYQEKLLRLDYSFTNTATQGLYVHFKKAF